MKVRMSRSNNNKHDETVQQILRKMDDSLSEPVIKNSGASSTTTAVPSTVGGGVDLPPMPKHVPFPEFPGSSEVLNELIMFLFIICVTALQFIHIYRTGDFWLPESHTHHYVNYYLINSNLVVLILLITSRRLIYCLLLRALELLRRSKQHRLLHKVFKYSFGCSILALISYYMIKLTVEHTYISFFLMIYPASVYLLIFGFRIEPFLRSSCEIEGTYFNDLPVHCCSSNPVTIREEVDVLRTDFNSRFKQVLFTSFLNAHYAGFVPCYFANAVCYNVIWVMQHIVLVWLSALMMCIMFLFPSKYSDILHRASLHLGHWLRIEERPSSEGVSAVNWNKNLIWSHGSVVKYGDDIYRAKAPVTVSIPGNSSHTRFYRLFYNPTEVYMVLTVIQAGIVVFQLVCLYFAVEWHFLLSISFITLTNQFTFFKIMRDYLISKRIYTTETHMIDKTNDM